MLFLDVNFDHFIFVMVPVCASGHWFLMVANMNDKTVKFLDSLPCVERHQRFLEMWG